MDSMWAWELRECIMTRCVPRQSPTHSAPLAPRIDELCPIIRDALPWSPLDFIRGISVDGDREVLAASLLRRLDPRDDLRLISRLDSGAEVAVLAERLPWDSAFFGFEVARLNGVFPLGEPGYSLSADYTSAICSLVQTARTAGIRYLFSVVDARDLPTIRALGTAGFALLETRLTWHRPLHDFHHRRYRCRRATEADLGALLALAAEIENPYDRFSADPFIPKNDIVRLMQTWLRASVVEGFADTTFIPDSPAPRAFCTLKYHDDKAAAWGVSIAQQVLAMAARDAGSGFVATVAESDYHLKERGADHVIFTTQATNRSMARAVDHFSYRYGKAEHVFRLLV